MKTANIILLLVGTLFFSCEGDLPEPSSNGSNTFGCKINGDKFVPRNTDFKNNPTYASITNQGLVVSGTSSHSGILEQVAMNIGEGHFKGKGTYILDESRTPKMLDLNYGQYSYKNYDKGLGKEEYHTDDEHTGKLIITHFDAGKKIVAGTFEFKAKSPTTGETVNITDGRFDIVYRTY